MIALDARTCSKCSELFYGRMPRNGMCPTCAANRVNRRADRPESLEAVARAIGLPPASPLITPLDLELCGKRWPRPARPYDAIEIADPANLERLRTITFIGPVGTGKSRLALELAYLAFRAGRSARFMAGLDVKPHWLEEAAEVAAVDVLVLDDVDRGSNAEWVAALIASRYEAGRLTIATTNTPLVRPERPGGRILYAWNAAAADRLAAGPIVLTTGASLRGRK